MRAYDRLYRYGLSLEEFEQLFAEQDGRCAICRQLKRLNVDHDHADGRVRGLICHKCNARIAALEDAAWRVSAEAYLVTRAAK